MPPQNFFPFLKTHILIENNNENLEFHPCLYVLFVGELNISSTEKGSDCSSHDNILWIAHNENDETTLMMSYDLWNVVKSGAEHGSFGTYNDGHHMVDVDGDLMTVIRRIPPDVEDICGFKWNNSLCNFEDERIMFRIPIRSRASLNQRRRVSGPADWQRTIGGPNTDLVRDEVGLRLLTQAACSLKARSLSAFYALFRRLSKALSFLVFFLFLLFLPSIIQIPF